MTKPIYQPIQIFYNGFQLVLTVGSESTYYLTMPQEIHSKFCLKPGAYLVKLQEITLSSLGAPSSSNLSCLLRQKEDLLFETLNFKLYSSDGTFGGSQNFHIFNSNINSGICMPSSPFSNFLGILNIAAKNSRESVIPFMINTDKTTSLNLEALKNHVPDNVIEDIRHYGNQYGIVSDLRLAHFLGQMKVESNFKGITEHVEKYTKANVLDLFKTCKESVKAKPKPCFPTPESTMPYLKDAKKLANYVYTFKDGLGNIKPGDGYKFTGRGGIQLTGRAQYQDFADSIGDPEIMENPDLVNSKYPILSALHRFKSKNYWPIIDKGNSENHLNDSVLQLTRQVNGKKMVGLEKRIAVTKEFCQILGVQLSI